MSRRIVITTDYLEPGDSVDRLLRDDGLEPVYSPAAGSRTEDEQRNLLADAVGAIVASEPITKDMLAEAADLRILARSGVGYDSVDTTAAQGYAVPAVVAYVDAVVGHDQRTADRVRPQIEAIGHTSGPALLRGIHAATARIDAEADAQRSVA